MPGKVNPVIPEAVTMVAAQVMGNDVAITIAGQSGNFQLNVMLPLIANALLQSLDWLSNAARALADSAIAGFEVHPVQLGAALERNPVLVTALNPLIGYERGAAIAKRALAEGRSVRAVAMEMLQSGELVGVDEAELNSRLDPLTLTQGGLAEPSGTRRSARSP
jgi:fumarate hydratase class II